MTDKLFLDEGWRVANDEEVWDASGLHQIATCGVPGRAPNPEQAARFAELIAQLPTLVKALTVAAQCLADASETAFTRGDNDFGDDLYSQSIAAREVLVKASREVSA
jgi:hypothetical protein